MKIESHSLEGTIFLSIFLLGFEYLSCFIIKSFYFSICINPANYSILSFIFYQPKDDLT